MMKFKVFFHTLVQPVSRNELSRLLWWKVAVYSINLLINNVNFFFKYQILKLTENKDSWRISRTSKYPDKAKFGILFNQFNIWKNIFKINVFLTQCKKKYNQRSQYFIVSWERETVDRQNLKMFKFILYDCKHVYILYYRKRLLNRSFYRITK